jgi:hypothetical protein
MVKLPANLAARFVLSGVTSPREVLRNGQEVDWTTINEDTALHILKFNLSPSLALAPPPPAQPEKTDKKSSPK